MNLFTLPGGKMKPFKGNMDSGDAIPVSGTYGFRHVHFAGSREIPLLQGRKFPFCPKCLDAVRFVLLRAVPSESASERFRLLMHGSNISALKHLANAA
jgi:hypothetical protein